MRRVLFPFLLLLVGCADQVVGVYQTPPTAAIDVPADGAAFSTTSVTFNGTVLDNQDSPPDLVVRWSTSLLPDEPLFEGAPDSTGFTTLAAQLDPGQHLITLRVTDTDGETDEDSVTITVSEPAPDVPTVFIDTPLAGETFLVSVPVTFTGTVAGNNDDLVMDIAWTSSLDGMLVTGNSDSLGETNHVAILSAGLHVITLSATDDWSQTGSDTVSINIVEQDPGTLDQDGDGFCPDGIDADLDGECDETELTGTDSQDCDDADPQTYPGAPEICDQEDNDCDGVIPADEADLDGDGVAPCQGDCDDQNPANFPGNTEICDDIDNNCDGQIDETDQDNDGDGFTGCDGDCNDNNSAVFPNAVELCNGIDDNCDGNIDEIAVNLDGDAFGTCDGDCDDTNPQVYPGAPELCDGIDNDCNGQIDETNVDNDGDGWTICDGDCDDGDGQNFPGNPEICDAADNNCDGNIDEHDGDLDFDGYRVCSGDCDDTNPNVNPSETEVCDDLDNNCDGQIDENDANADGDPASLCDGDCLDNNPTVYPGAPELCDGLDNNCDTSVPIDEVDLDGDGWRPCNGDCDDGNPLINPSAAEVCDTWDNDCDGTANEHADPTELGESSSTAYNEAQVLPGFNHILHAPPFSSCPGATCQVFGGLFTLCRNVISTGGAFAAPQDAFDSFVLDYDQMATTLGCAMNIGLSGIPSGHDYSLTLYKADSPSEPPAAWDLLAFSDNAGSAPEAITQQATNFLDFGTDTFFVVVHSKGNWSCPNAGNYTLTITGG